jgi:ABC-type bacteriocin/lantibiotic exporter with double-glycine peptidase domain
MGLYLVTDAGMRLVRSRATECISVDQTLRCDEKIWSKMVAQVDLPSGGFPRFLSNYRDLTLARDFVSSNYLLSIADIPFLLLYLEVIGFISWPLMVASAVLVLLFSCTGFILYARQTKLSKEAEQKKRLNCRSWVKLWDAWMLFALLPDPVLFCVAGGLCQSSRRALIRRNAWRRIICGCSP